MNILKSKLITFSILILALGLSFNLVSCNKDDDDDDDTTSDVVVEDNLPDISGFPIVGTNQTEYFDNTTIISAPGIGSDFYGQNADYPGNTPQYVDNGDGTVTDMVTGLMWQSNFDHNGDGNIDVSDKLSYNDLLALPQTCVTGGHTDWRVPTLKEQYSLIMFSGRDVSGYSGTDTESLTPFINTDYFNFAYGDTDNGERIIDVQCASTNVSVGNMEQMIFGVNFADGRIKAYGSNMMGQEKTFNYLMVRGNTSYGQNSFVDNSDGTISDLATGLMWMKDNSDTCMIWKDALAYGENSTFASHGDWRLPSAKELQSIVDYTRSPQSSASAAIDPLFNATQITNEANEVDYPFYWSNTTHASWSVGSEGAWGAYVAFGRAMGNMTEMPGPIANSGYSRADSTNWVDVHGAGAQRSDPKSGNPADWSEGNGPQGDAVRIYNYARLVRDI